MKKFRLFCCAALLSLAGSAVAATPAWIERSNQIANDLLLDRGESFPEGPSSQGKEEFDTAVIDLQPGNFERRIAQTEKRLTALRALRSTEQDIKVRQDIDILIASRVQSLASQTLWHQYVIGYADASSIANFGLSSLLDPRNRPERQARALIRLRRYAGLEAGYTPLTTLARVRTEEELARPGLVGPYVEEINHSLTNTDIYLKSLAEMFAKARLTGWQADFATLSKQLHEYNEWMRQTLLPRARTEVRLPPALYANQLKQAGVDISADELIERAGFDFQEVRDQMQLIAKQVAATHKFASSDYRDVIRELKKQQVEPEAMLATYRARLKDIEAIVRREHLVTLPAREAVIRAATEAETADTPSPQMRAPRLVGNTGEYGEFLIPLSNPHAKSGARMDDFSYDAVSWTLTAHEARPGHELQFASMVEHGTSLARAIYAGNSANTEGWALYCEAIVLPYMPPDGQLISLQFRLLRMARAFLDPMINLGRITPEDAKKFLMEEVLLSEPFAQQEVDRYAFNDPGQATAYYYGYLQLRTLRTQVELALGKKFNLMTFNDFVIAQGLLPPPILKQALLEEFVPSQLASPVTR